MKLTAADFVEENLKTIFAYSLSRVSNKTDAEDLCNDIVLAILQSADKIKAEKAFYGYVWGIAANTYRKFIRKRMRGQFEEIDENMPDKADFTEEIFLKEDITRLRREIALLSKEYRECTTLYYFDELSCREVAEKLDISLEMVKYYLFKTRKILKEGICMEREFGEKSFKPAPFEFRTIYTGTANREYSNLFKRKLPGQILLSAYYTSMSIRELAIELGVSSVYLEDELSLLEKYNLITRLPTGKYQTNLIIFTEDFTREFHKTAEKFATPMLGEIIVSLKTKLNDIRRINSICATLSDSHILWGLLWPVFRYANGKFSRKYPQYMEPATLYEGATGTNYGTSPDDSVPDKFKCDSFAGFHGLDRTHRTTFANFGVLPEKNLYTPNISEESLVKKIDAIVAGELSPEFMIFTIQEEAALLKLIDDEITMMAVIYDKLFDVACKLMHIHAPKSVETQIEPIIAQTLLFRAVGLIGGCASESGELNLPDFDGPAAMYARLDVESVNEAHQQI